MFTKKLILFVSIISVVSIISCKKVDQVETKIEKVSNEIIQAVKAQGFDTKSIMKTDGGYLVEGDIFLSDASLREKPSDPAIRIANVEQYRTFNLVNPPFPRTITVSVSTTTGLTPVYTAATDEAIARYNEAALNLCLRFQRVATGGMIQISGINQGPNPDGGILLGQAGFPSGGNPFNSIMINMGHCIGMRHTDFFNRSFSCGVVGTNNNEGQTTTGIGAINIPGTPTAEDPNSWMLACTNQFTNRPFNANDRIALRFLYGCQSNNPPYTIQTNPCSGIYSSATLFGNVGDVVVLKLSFGGPLSWNGQANGAGAVISLSAGGQSSSASSPHYYGSGYGFSLNATVTFTMTANSMPINTTAVINNSTMFFSSTATLTVVSVNGVSNGNQGVVCGGNSGGYW
jgi:Dual-action HEIGH metallo-peptidase